MAVARRPDLVNFREFLLHRLGGALWMTKKNVFVGAVSMVYWLMKWSARDVIAHVMNNSTQGPSTVSHGGAL